MMNDVQDAAPPVTQNIMMLIRDSLLVKVAL